MCQSDAQIQLRMDTFYLFVILRFRLELRWPSDVNREATIFSATPAKAPGAQAFYKVLITSNLQGTSVTDAHKFEGTWRTPLLAYRWQSPVYEKAMFQMMLYYKQNSYKQCIKTEFWRVSARSLAIKHAIPAQGGVTSLQYIYIFSENQLSQPTKHYLAWQFLRTKVAFQLVLSVKSPFLRTGQLL